MKKLKACVVGCGSVSVMHLDSIKLLPQSELVGVCDIKEERAKKASEKYGANWYTDYIEMFKAEKPDVAHICLPHYLHTVVAQDAIKMGIHVISEKPMSIDYASAEATVELAKMKNVKYGVIFQCRYNTPSIMVKKRIAEGKLGNVKCGRVVLTWYRPDDYYDFSDWKGTWEKEGGGVVIDQAIHSLDLANWFIDSTPTDVQATLNIRNHSKLVVEDTAEGLVKYENGALLAFYAMNNYLIDDSIEIRLVCENGNAVVSYDNATIKYNDGEIEEFDNSPQTQVKYSGGKEYWGFQHATQIEQFYGAVLGEEELEISGEEALKIQKIVCEIYKNKP